MFQQILIFLVIASINCHNIGLSKNQSTPYHVCEHSKHPFDVEKAKQTQILY